METERKNRDAILRHSYFITGQSQAPFQLQATGNVGKHPRSEETLPTRVTSDTATRARPQHRRFIYPVLTAFQHINGVYDVIEYECLKIASLLFHSYCFHLFLMMAYA